jgi:multidrug efflux pump subunit AcrA (membrane-fusion protein)
MTCDVTIHAQKLEDVLLVPLSATRAGTEERDSTIVNVLKEGEDEFSDKAVTEEKVVKLGDTDFVDVVVLEGLEEGDKVKVRGFSEAISFE